MAKSSFVPQRAKIQYKYAIGIAMKNYQPLLSKEVCDFIVVHMPHICAYNYWENAVRNNLTTCDWFEKVELRSEAGKKCFYKFTEGALEKFHEQFPITYGDPEDFLTNAENHTKLYKGEMGYPNKEEIEAARIAFEEKRESWAKLENDSKGYKTKNAKKKQIFMAAVQKMEPTTDQMENVDYSWNTEANGTQNNQKMVSHQKNFWGKKEENIDYYENSEVLAPVENQVITFENFGQYKLSARSHHRNQKPPAFGTRTTPYQRPTVAFPERNELPVEHISPLSHYHHNVIQTEIPNKQPNYLIDHDYLLIPIPSHNVIEQIENTTHTSYEKYQVCEAPHPQIRDEDYEFFNQFFASPIVHPQGLGLIPNAAP